MLKIRPLNDLHLEFGSFTIPSLPEDKDTVLILAGDIDVDSSERFEFELLSFLTNTSKQFREVIMILGNHEYYHGSLIFTPKKLKKLTKNLSNVHVLDNEHITIDDVLFVGSTLWTDFNKGDPLVMHAAGYGMNDFRIIRTGTIDAPYMRKITPNDILKIHEESKKYVFDTIAKEKPNHRKVVLIIHHAPTYKSVHPKYTGDMLNGAFVSDLSNEILDTEPDLIIHGHVHDSFDYTVGYYTRVLCNPRGYQGREMNLNFDPYLRVEI